MSTQSMTQKELNSLIDKRQSLKDRLDLSLLYERKALSPAEYLNIKKEVEKLDNQISNAKIIPQIKLNRKFTVKVDNETIAMVITVNATNMANVQTCTFNSILGKALIDKMVGDLVEIETLNGLKTYEVLSIEEN